MNNLDHCTEETRGFVEKVLEDPAIRSLARATIMIGLADKDCVDAVADVSLALKVLKAVMNDISRG